MAKPTAFKNWPKSLGPSYGPLRAVLDHWRDADTGVFLVDFGMEHYDYVAVRVEGFSSPESGTEAGDAATLFANLLAPPGSRVRLASKKPIYAQTLSRWVASIELEGGMDYGSTMLAAGHTKIGSFMG